MNYELIANIADTIGMGSFVFLLLVFAFSPIFNTIHLLGAHNQFYKILFGPNPERCLMAAVSFGYIFLICGIIIISLACCSTFFEYRIAYIITVVVAGFSLGIVASIAAFFGYINPDKCNEYELYLILGLFSNTTYPPLEEWKLENRCLEPADCLVPAHNYIQTKCRTPFTVNLSVECASVALIIIVSICTSLTQCVLPQDEHTPVEV